MIKINISEWKEDIIDRVKEIYYIPKRFLEKVGNFFYWGWQLRDNWDWDSSFMLRMMLIKMKKMQKYLYKYGHSVPSEDPTSDMHKTLRTLIKLCERLINRDPMFYSERAWEAFDKKWGKLETWSTPTDNPKLSNLHFKRDKVTDENRKQFKKEERELYKYQTKLYYRDRKLFFQILEKHLDNIWD